MRASALDFSVIVSNSRKSGCEIGDQLSLCLLYSKNLPQAFNLGKTLLWKLSLD